MDTTERTYTAFAGDRQIASGDLRALLTSVKRRPRGAGSRPPLFFEDWTGRQVDFDLRGTPAEAVARAEAARAPEENVGEARRGGRSSASSRGR